MRPLAVLRPEPGASRTLERARARGLIAFAVPLFQIEPLRWEPPPGTHFDGLLLTSANAVRCAGEQLRRFGHLPVHAVGPATAEAAQEAGLQVETTGCHGVDSLLAQLPPGLRLLHLCGEDRKAPSGSSQQRITERAVYRSTAIPAPSGLERLPGSVALVHSPRAGERLRDLVTARSHVGIAAISCQAAKACGPGWAELAVAAEPTDDALLSLSARLCEQLDRT